MRVTILAHGSRGDVQPYLALSLGLARAGHTVRLAAPEIYRGWVEEHGLAFAPLAGDPRQLMRRAARGSLLPTPIQSAWNSLRYVAPVAEQLAQDILAASLDADVLVHSMITTALGHLVARLRGIPDIAALIFPVFTLTSAFPNPLFPTAAARPGYNLFTHHEFNRVFWLTNRIGVHLLRRRIPWLPALGEWPFGAAQATAGTPVLYGISRHALPQAAEAGISQRFTGYWFLDSQGWQPPERLVQFLAAGDAPVLASFGSLIPQRAASLNGMILRVLERIGRRAVLVRGWSDSPGASLPDWACAVDNVPHEWLFPRLAAAIHHGGMGTTAAALQAGIPAVIIPFTFDQPFWGRQVHRLGAGPAPISPSRLNEPRLEEAIQAALYSPGIRARAAELGQAIRAEDGVAAAVQAIERHVKR